MVDISVLHDPSSAGDWVPEAYLPAVILESHLGDPHNPANATGWASSLLADEREVFPESAWRCVIAWGIGDYLIPLEAGGQLRSLETLMAIFRVLSRRDITLSIAIGQGYLASVPVWVGGTQEQKARVAHRIRRGEAGCLGLTEENHGADLLACETVARPAPGGYRLFGSKWLINNGTRHAFATVYARTSAGGGPRGFSLFLLERDSQEEGCFSSIPKVKTLGVRGADISGFNIEGGWVAEDGRVGAEGAGLELTLKGLQITRGALCGALSLGACDSALRVVMAFARQRQLYGGSVLDIPHARRLIMDAFLSLLIAECLMMVTARAFHFVPGQMSLGASIAKYFVPVTIDAALRDLAGVYGARHYLRAAPSEGIFQKILRDHALVGLFDGSTAVNLHQIGQQLRQLSATRGRASAANQAADIDPMFELSTPVPTFDPTRLDLTARGRDSVVQGLDTARRRLDEMEPDGVLRPELLLAIRSEVEALVQAVVELDAAVERHAAEATFSPRSPVQFELAARYCTLHAGAACVQLWLANRSERDAFFSGGAWLALALDKLLASFYPERRLVESPFASEVFEQLQQLDHAQETFSILPFRLPVFDPAP